MIGQAYALGNAGTAHTVPLLEGDAGTEQTIAAIRELVDQGLRDPAVRQAAGWIVSRVPAYDELAEARAIYDWVRGTIRFVKDAAGKETVSSARWTLSHRFGDCDDINAVLLPALLGAIGYHTRLVTIASNPFAPEQFSHVYAEVALRGQWIPVDAARPGARFGQAPQRYSRKRVWSLTDENFQDVRGLSGYAVAQPIYLPAEATGMGGFWDELASALPGIERTISSTITAIRAPKTSLTPGVTSFQFPATAAPAPSGGLDMNTLLLLGLGAGAIFLLAKKS